MLKFGPTNISNLHVSCNFTADIKNLSATMTMHHVSGITSTYLGGTRGSFGGCDELGFSEPGAIYE